MQKEKWFTGLNTLMKELDFLDEIWKIPLYTPKWEFILHLIQIIRKQQHLWVNFPEKYPNLLSLKDEIVEKHEDSKIIDFLEKRVRDLENDALFKTRG